MAAGPQTLKVAHQNLEHLYRDPNGAQTSLVAQTEKRLPAVWETCVQSLGRGDPLEKEMATHSSILAWRIPWSQGAWRVTVRGVAKSRT